MTAHTLDWWRNAVVYQVYIRSFADGNGDGTGDITGLRAKLDHLARLGVDAIWINPWYPSPLADGGYDVADYRAINPMFGDTAQAEALIAEAHGRGIRVLLDIVPNHHSDQHAWFRAALDAAPGSPERAHYVFRDGRGPGGDEPPNNWRSMFGGPAWERVPDGQWYLHLFDVTQPDVDWENPEVRADFEETLRFWFDRGVDGFRIDVANSMVKEPGLPDLVAGVNNVQDGGHPYLDREGVHEVYRSWRAIADSYDPPKVFVAEAWVPDPERLARYLRPDELQTAFGFNFLTAAWLADDLRRNIDDAIAENTAVGAPATWVLSNHDVCRHPSRLARKPEAGRGWNLDDVLDLPADPETGLRRARAATLLMLALPGTAYLYQGEEFGLPEVEDIPVEKLDDPTWVLSGHTKRGRDGCRVPLPWAAGEPWFGFGGPAWLPQPDVFARHAADVQEADPDSVLHLYRDALAIRRAHPALGGGSLTWQDSPEGTLALSRTSDEGDGGFTALVNVSSAPVSLPEDAEVMLASGPLTPRGEVPADTTVWLRTA
ncbi:Alpha-glucosidase [Pseudonocardia sp. Ae168_Ps1]|uniref:glycoside hydrolase family 13 protein n=1 Tax=unclassified Pseudonocardia TaxID=2619320 RepID=UPI00094B65F4|nr:MULTISPECIES: glycoside hydrolase family 13 protein [unclassified Pseudonocardia]OLL76077.1 Alpha-glucosidase [Pseudonocardia sp. Ae150A_Ps1]OLL82076.1 Alpha-glucosidase [Pseudonocardia sp. Ae168_Ps1]OLL83811.1 Alpha-glucosidase [Pseudonocardia sp. Ae263_Ps1]OLL90150.1 Alpha-glucosidase [Pseudonocardia sp. Ae356_Ps1]